MVGRHGRGVSDALTYCSDGERVVGAAAGVLIRQRVSTL